MSNSFERREDGSLALFIDGDLQFDSNDERTYHEALALPALAIASQRIKAPLRVLVIGGGDGLIAREFFKSSETASLDLVDYDPEILNIARQDIAELNNHSLSDARITIHTKDAWAFVDEALADNIVYDAIVVDLTGAVEPSTVRFHSIEWYSKLSRLLKREGVLSVNAVSAQRTPQAYWSIFNSLAKANLHTRPYHVNIPSFAAQGYGEDWGFFIASGQLITIDELGENLPLAHPRYFLKNVDDLRKLFIFPEEILAYQPKSSPGLINSDVLMHYFLNPSVGETYSGAIVNSLALDTRNLFIPEPDHGKNILPQPVRSMLAESVYQGGPPTYADPQLLLKNVLELMPSLETQHTPELIADFLENPAVFLEAIDLPALVSKLLKRASELPARLVAELELLRDTLKEWVGDHHSLLLNMGPRVITILTLLIVVGNLLYPDVVYGKGEHGGHEGHHEHAAAAGRRGGVGYGGGYGGTYYTNPYYTKKQAPLNINQHNHIPGQPQIQNTGVPFKKGGQRKAPDTVGFANDLDKTRMISSDVYLTEDGKYIAVKTDADQVIYVDGHNWYSDQGQTVLDQPYPDNFKTILISHLSSVVKQESASQNRLLKTKAEFANYAETLTNELSQFKSTPNTEVSFGTHVLPVAEAIRRTQSSLKLISRKIESLDEQIKQVPLRVDLAKIALANLSSQES